MVPCEQFLLGTTFYSYAPPATEQQEAGVKFSSLSHFSLLLLAGRALLSLLHSRRGMGGCRHSPGFCHYQRKRAGGFMSTPTR